MLSLVSLSVQLRPVTDTYKDERCNRANVVVRAIQSRLDLANWGTVPLRHFPVCDTASEAKDETWRKERSDRLKNLTK